jgi:single-strand DNA-binding protein
MNNVDISGNLVRDPKVTFTPKGTAKCSFTLAQNIGKGEAKRGHFFKCVAWKDVAEGIAEKYAKGKPIQVRGMLTQDQWDDKKTGEKRSEVVIVVFEASVPEYAKKQDPPPDDDIPF